MADDPRKKGMLPVPVEPEGVGMLTANPQLMRQLANQRAANPRPDVTDFMGYGPDWRSYLAGFAQNVKENFPSVGDTREQGMAKMLGLFSPGVAGATVFHGSPYKFDKFDLSKVGTGEGAQAYGHGLYLAESPQTAGYYRSALSNDQPSTRLFVDGKPILERFGGNNLFASDVAAQIERSGMDIEKAISTSSSEAVRKAIEGLRGSRVSVNRPGNLYRVDLPDEAIGKMLDWDAPLSKQPEAVRKAIHQLTDRAKLEAANPDALTGMATWADRTARRVSPDLLDKMDGAAIHEMLQKVYGNSVSAELRGLGIPGIKYLDQGSRGKGAGTYNYVVFDDSLPKIIGRE